MLDVMLKMQSDIDTALLDLSSACLPMEQLFSMLTHNILSSSKSAPLLYLHVIFSVCPVST